MDALALGTLRDVGGWVFAGFVLAVLLWALFRSIQTGTLVPGTLHTRVLDQNDKLTEAITRLTAAQEVLSAKVEELLRADRRR